MNYKIKTLWKPINHKYTQVVQEREGERHTERMCTLLFAFGGKRLWPYKSLSVRKDPSTKCQNDINEKGSLAFLHRTNIFLLIPMKNPDTTQPANLCLLLPVM